MTSESSPPPSPRRLAWGWLGFVVVVAVVTYWPAVHAGFLADDVYQIALFDGLLGPRSPWSLYTLFPADPQAIATHVERGSLPWWTIPEFRFVQVRPLSSLLLALDHTVRPHDALAHHLHSLLWLAATLTAAHALLRRATTPWIAAVALLVYALDETFGWTVAWLANRCSMVAATFAFAALALHLRGCTHDSRRRRVLELGAWLLAFGAGEYALCGLAYALAFALAGRTDAWRRRVVALLPALGAFVAFTLVYLAMGGGVSGATSYVDPLAHPLEFAWACLDRVPRMLGEIGLSLPGESDRLLIRYEGSIALRVLMTLGGVVDVAALPLHHARMVVVGLVVVLGPAWWLARSQLQPEERRAVRWMLLGSLLALVPLAAILPSTRALALAALGPAVLVASLGVAAVRAWRARPETWPVRSRAVLLSLLAGGLLLQHTLLDAIWARAQIAGIRSTGESYQRFVVSPALRQLDLRDKQVVVISAPGLVTGLHSQWIMHLYGIPRPRSLHVLEVGERRLLVRRFHERGLEISTVSRVMFDQPQETLFRPPPEALRRGDAVQAGPLRATVVHERSPGAVDAVRFAFDRRLEDPSLVFLVGGPQGLEPFVLPAVGKAALVPPPVLPGLDDEAPSPR